MSRLKHFFDNVYAVLFDTWFDLTRASFRRCNISPTKSNDSNNTRSTTTSVSFPCMKSVRVASIEIKTSFLSHYQYSKFVPGNSVSISNR